jgi:transcriptional regulator with XRE-family HTH domain
MIGTKLLALRRERNMSQGELAAALDKRQSTISMIELGSRNPSYELLLEIAAYFGVEPGYFLTPDPTPNPSPDPA